MEELTGLIICGGHSSRMGRDKGRIAWHGIEQRYFLYQMLELLCKKVQLSCNAVQANEIEPGYEYIVDDEKYNKIGPMAALLTAFNKYPGESFLVVGCDYPFIRKEDMFQLINSRNENDTAVSFFNGATGFYEPLLAVYENKIAGLLVEHFDQQQYSLQAMLKTSNACKINPSEITSIKSVDTPEDYLNTVQEIKRTNY